MAAFFSGIQKGCARIGLPWCETFWMRHYGFSEFILFEVCALWCMPEPETKPVGTQSVDTPAVQVDAHGTRVYLG